MFVAPWRISDINNQIEVPNIQLKIIVLLKEDEI